MRPARPKRWTKQEDGELAALMRPLVHTTRLPREELRAFIKRSRFIVADFTHGEKGARGGVYYEAGFAHGLGIPVIFTCRKDIVEDVHFDTRQYNHIVWDSPEDLRDKLGKRISATIGDGPK